MCIRILDPLELRNNGRKESMDVNKMSMNYREAECLFPDGEGMVTSLMDDVTVREQDGERRLDKLVARRCESMRSRLCLFAEQSRRKVITGYNKVITITTVC